MELDCNYFLLLAVLSLTLLRRVSKWVSGPLSKLIACVINPEPLELSHLRSEVEKLQRELQSISQVDNFADHSRSQRALQQAESKLVASEKSYKGTLSTYLTFTQWTFTLLLLLCRVVLVLSYKGVPVVILPPDSLWPLRSLLSFPTGVPGAVGLPAWTLMCAIAVGSLDTTFKT